MSCNDHNILEKQIFQNMELAKNTEEELRRKVTTLEKELKDAHDNESALQNERIIWEGKHDAIMKELENVREHMENIRADSEVVITITYAIEENDMQPMNKKTKNGEIRRRSIGGWGGDGRNGKIQVESFIYCEVIFF